MDLDRVVGQPRAAPALGDVVAEHRAHGAVDVMDGQGERHRLRVLDGLPAGRDDRRGVEGLLQGVILRDHTVPRDLGRHVRLVEDRREVETPRLPVLERRLDVELVDPADHLVHGPEAEFRHVLSDLLGQKAEEGHDVLGLAAESLPELGVLGGDAHGAGVEVTDAHHNAAQHDERRR